MAHAHCAWDSCGNAVYLRPRRSRASFSKYEPRICVYGSERRQSLQTQNCPDKTGTRGNLQLPAAHSPSGEVFPPARFAACGRLHPCKVFLSCGRSHRSGSLPKRLPGRERSQSFCGRSRKKALKARHYWGKRFKNGVSRDGRADYFTRNRSPSPGNASQKAALPLFRQPAPRKGCVAL